MACIGGENGNRVNFFKSQNENTEEMRQEDQDHETGVINL